MTLAFAYIGLFCVYMAFREPLIAATATLIDLVFGGAK
jgi:hypothetical protein